MKSLGGKDHRLGSISQIACFGDTSDEITGMTALCEYTLRQVDICNFCLPQFLKAWLPVSPVQASQLFGDILDIGK